MTQATELTIAGLILERSQALALTRSDLVRRAGFKNVAKGLRRLDELCAGDLKSTASLIAGLPAALEVPPEAVTEAIRRTEQQIAEAKQLAEQEEEAAWRAKFQPCAYLLGTSDRPSSITFYGITGGADRWLTIPLDLSWPPVTYAAQSLEIVRKTPEVKFFGPTTGFIVNYDPDTAVRFDVDGNPVEVLDQAYRPEKNEVMIIVGGKAIPAETFGKIIGTIPRS